MSVQELKNEMLSANDKFRTLRSMLKKCEPEMARALPKHITVERMTRIALTEIRKNKELLDCEQSSFLGAIIQCAQLGLEPGNVLGHVYLIPYRQKEKKVVQIILGYRGMLELARRSGRLISITAHSVYPCDEFEVEFGLNPSLTHRPNFAERKPNDKPEFVYAVAKLRDGGIQFDVMHITEIERHRERGGQRKFSPWVTDYEEMAKKTVVRRLFKMLPTSIELSEALSIEEKQISDSDGELIEGDFSIGEEEKFEQAVTENIGEENAISQ